MGVNLVPLENDKSCMITFTKKSIYKNVHVDIYAYFFKIPVGT
jgi:hypothetical protein